MPRVKSYCLIAFILLWVVCSLAAFLIKEPVVTIAMCLVGAIGTALLIAEVVIDKRKVLNPT